MKALWSISKSLSGRQPIFFKYIQGVLRLDDATFVAIEHDESVTIQALLLVMSVGLLEGLYLVLDSSQLGPSQLTGYSTTNLGLGLAGLAISSDALTPAGLLAHSLGATLLMWLLWSIGSWWLGTRLFAGTGTMGGMLRTISFAQVPYLMTLFMLLIPQVGWYLSWIGWGISMVAIGTAIEQGLSVRKLWSFFILILILFTALMLNWFIVRPILAAFAF